MVKAKSSKTFQFDPTRTVDDNIERFLDVLDARDSDLATIFRQQIGLMLPLPLDPQARSAARMKFNSAVLKAIDVLEQP